MDIKVYAFELNFRHGIDIDDLFNHVQSKGDNDVQKIVDYLENGGDKPNINKIVSTSSRTSNLDYIVGISLSIKDVSAFCSLKANNGKLEVSAEQLESGTLMTDFNFFVIHKPTGRGLYQHYFQSQATTTFCKLLKDHYRTLRGNLVASETEVLQHSQGFSKKKALRQAKQKYFHFLPTSVIERPEDIGELISELTRIDSLAFEPESYEDYTQFGRPYQGLIKKVKPVIYFEKGQNVMGQCKEWAASLFTANDIKAAIVKGIDINGNEATIKLNNDYQVLHKYDYDDLIVTISLDDLTTSLDNATIITELLNLSQTQSIKSLLESTATE